MARLTLRGWLRQAYLGAFLRRIANRPHSSDWRRSAIVFAPHPDDETLACGGTIAKKRRAGAAVTVVFMTDGRFSHAHLMPADDLALLRRQEARAACHRLGVASADVLFLDFPDNDLEAHEAQAAERVRTILWDRWPQEVYVPYHGEPPRDHMATYRAVAQALQAHPAPVTVYAYPVWFWDHWPWTRLVRPGRRATATAVGHTLAAWFGLRMLRLFPHVVDVSDAMADKRAALAAHRTQMERMQPETAWPILADVSNGDFLGCFMQPFELFRRYEAGPGHFIAPVDKLTTIVTEKVK